MNREETCREAMYVAPKAPEYSGSLRLLIHFAAGDSATQHDGLVESSSLITVLRRERLDDAIQQELVSWDPLDRLHDELTNRDVSQIGRCLFDAFDKVSKQSIRLAHSLLDVLCFFKIVEILVVTAETRHLQVSRGK